MAGVSVVLNGRSLRVQTDFSLVVEFDGIYTATVGVQDSYSGLLQGLCQDGNNDATNDCTQKDGTDVTGVPHASSLVGNSYQVVDPEIPKLV